MNKIKSTIAGIPCLINVTLYRPGVPPYVDGPDYNWHAGEPAEIEYEVLDTAGRPAPWLERKLTAADQRRIEEEIEKERREE